jgi:hypothetical protein
VGKWFHVCGGAPPTSPSHSNCTKRAIGDTTCTSDTSIDPEPKLHYFGHSLMLPNNKQWQTGGILASNVNLCYVMHIEYILFIIFASNLNFVVLNFIRKKKCFQPMAKQPFGMKMALGQLVPVYQCF